MKVTTRALAVTVLVWATCAAADTELKIITNKGYVAFAAADQWLVLQMQTTMPVAAAVFQLPNAADARHIGFHESDPSAIRARVREREDRL